MDVADHVQYEYRNNVKIHCIAFETSRRMFSILCYLVTNI